MRRILLTVVAMLIPVMGVTLAIAGGTASAGTGKLTCTSLSGTASGTITVSGCTGGHGWRFAAPVRPGPGHRWDHRLAVR